MTNEPASPDTRDMRSTGRWSATTRRACLGGGARTGRSGGRSAGRFLIFGPDPATAVAWAAGGLLTSPPAVVA